MSKKTTEQIAAEKARLLAEEKKIVAEEALEKASDALKVAAELYKGDPTPEKLTRLRATGGDLAVAKVALDIASEEFEKTRIRRPRKTVAPGA